MKQIFTENSIYFVAKDSTGAYLTQEFCDEEWVYYFDGSDLGGFCVLEARNINVLKKQIEKGKPEGSVTILKINREIKYEVEELAAPDSNL